LLLVVEKKKKDEEQDVIAKLYNLKDNNENGEIKRDVILKDGDVILGGSPAENLKIKGKGTIVRNLNKRDESYSIITLSE